MKIISVLSSFRRIFSAAEYLPYISGEDVDPSLSTAKIQQAPAPSPRFGQCMVNTLVSPAKVQLIFPSVLATGWSILLSVPSIYVTNGKINIAYQRLINEIKSLTQFAFNAILSKETLKEWQGLLCLIKTLYL